MAPRFHKIKNVRIFIETIRVSGINFSMKVFITFIMVILAYTKENNTIPGDPLVKGIFNADLKM